MTISLVGEGALAVQTGNLSPATVDFPADLEEHDQIVLLVASGNDTNEQPTTPTDWEFIDTAVGGPGSWGAGSGPRRISTYRRIADGTESGSISLAWVSTGGSAVLGAQMFAWRTDDGDWDDTVFVSGEDTVGDGTAAVTTEDLDLAPGDVLLGLLAVTSDSFLTGPSFTAAGITFDGVTTQEQRTIGSGNLMGILTASGFVDSGEDTVPVTFSMSLFGDGVGGVGAILRLRDGVSGGSEPTTIDGTVAAAGGAGAAAVVNARARVNGVVGAAAGVGLQAAVRLPARANATVAQAAGVGAAATVQTPTRLNGTVALGTGAGLSATVLLSGVISTTVAQANAVGLTASVQTATTISAGVGAAVSTGAAAAVAQNTRINTGVAAATVEGLAADITSTEGGGVGAAAVWSHGLTNGQSAGATLVAVQVLLTDLAKVHGLVLGMPLVNTATSRVAGDIEQTIEEDETGTVTLTRQP